MNDRSALETIKRVLDEVPDRIHAELWVDANTTLGAFVDMSLAAMSHADHGGVKVRPLIWRHDGELSYAYCGVTDTRWNAAHQEGRDRADKQRADRILSALTQAPAPTLTGEVETPAPVNNVAGVEPHPDDLAVDRFTAAMAEKMKAKLAKKRGQGVTGWDDPEVCHIDYLVSLLLEQIHERAVLDPIDIANIAMMIHERGETPTHGR